MRCRYDIAFQTGRDFGFNTFLDWFALLDETFKAAALFGLLNVTTPVGSVRHGCSRRKKCKNPEIHDGICDQNDGLYFVTNVQEVNYEQRVDFVPCITHE